jgi:hypothetical protein
MRLRSSRTAWSWVSVDLAAPSVLAIAGEGMGVSGGGPRCTGTARARSSANWRAKAIAAEDCRDGSGYRMSRRHRIVPSAVSAAELSGATVSFMIAIVCSEPQSAEA